MSADLNAEYMCVCGHPEHLHNGPRYATGLGTTGQGCDECGCAYLVVEVHIGGRASDAR